MRRLWFKFICIGVVVAGSMILSPRTTHGAMTVSHEPMMEGCSIQSFPTSPYAERLKKMNNADVLREVKQGVEGMVAAQKGIEAKVLDIETRVEHLDGYIISTKRGGPSFVMPGDGGRYASSAKSPSGERAVNIFKIAAAQCLLKDGKTDAWKMVDGEYEKSIVEAQTKALDTGTAGSGGGFIVPPEVPVRAVH